MFIINIALFTAYNDALDKSHEGSKIDTTNKNLRKKELEALLTNLGNYVNTVANYDLLKLESSGTALYKTQRNHFRAQERHEICFQSCCCKRSFI